MLAYGRDTQHFLCKLTSSVKILSCLFCARTFGKYRHSVFDNGLEYAIYEWRGKVWAIPTTHISE